MYATYKVKMWIKAEIDSGTTLDKVLANIDNIPSNAVDFVASEDYLTDTEQFIKPSPHESTLKICLDNGKEIYTNKL